MKEIQMKNKIEFATLDHDTQVEIVRTLMCYDKCHIEHANGKIVVTPNWCICATYTNDFWVSQDFYHDDFDFDGFDYNTAWENVTQFWERMTDDQKKATIKNFESMTDLFAELAIQKYLLKKATLDKYYGRENK